eukprot:14688389-Alexandrium_andersonii.AAC.1
MCIRDRRCTGHAVQALSQSLKRCIITSSGPGGVLKGTGASWRRRNSCTHACKRSSAASVGHWYGARRLP